MALSLIPAAARGCFPESGSTAGAGLFRLSESLLLLPDHVGSEAVCQPADQEQATNLHTEILLFSYL